MKNNEKKKSARKYMTTRDVYKDVKKYDRSQFDLFCTKIYTEGFKDGEKSVKGVDYQSVIDAVKAVKGVGEKRLAQIERSITALYEK